MRLRHALCLCGVFLFWAPCLARAQEVDDDTAGDDADAGDDNAGHTAGAGSTPGDAADRESRIHFESGRAYFERGDYENAAREFETGYARQPLGAFLFNLYLTYERTGDFGRAADNLERYLAAETEVDERQTLEERLANLRRRAAGEPAPQPAPEPGPEPEPEPTRTDPGNDFTVPAIISFSVGGLGFVALGVFGALALSEDSALEEECVTAYGIGGGYCTGDEVSTAQTYALIADIGLGVGIAGAVVGLILLLLSDGGSDDSSARIAPLVSPTVAGISAEVAIP